MLFNPMLMKKAVTAPVLPSLAFGANLNVVPGSTTYYTSSLPIGTASSTREVILVFALDTSGTSLTSVFFNTTIPTTISYITISSTNRFALVYGTVPTGTTCSIDVTFSGTTVSDCNFAVYNIKDRAVIGAAPYDTDYSAAVISTSSTISSINLPVNSFVLTAFARTNTSEVMAVSGLSTTINNQAAINTTYRCGWASSTLQTSALTGQSIVWSWTTSQTGYGASWVLN